MRTIVELAAKVARALYRWAVKLGRQILERLAKRAGMSAVEWCRARAKVAERKRLDILMRLRAKTLPARRRRSLVARHQIYMRSRAAWVRFATWLEAHVDQVTPAAVRLYCAANEAVVSRIPIMSEDERKCAA